MTQLDLCMSSLSTGTMNRSFDNLKSFSLSIVIICVLLSSRSYSSVTGVKSVFIQRQKLSLFLTFLTFFRGSLVQDPSPPWNPLSPSFFCSISFSSLSFYCITYITIIFFSPFFFLLRCLFYFTFVFICEPLYCLVKFLVPLFSFLI